MSLTADEIARLNLQLKRLQKRQHELESKRYSVGLTEIEKGYLEAIEWRIGYLHAVRDHDAEPLYPHDFDEGSVHRRFWFEKELADADR